jgi:transcriptional regulator with XRE-family HTH domain
VNPNPTEEWLTQPDGLTDRLRALRTQAGLSGKQLAELLGWQPSKVSRLENGKQMPAPADLEVWARACAAADAAPELVRMLGEILTTHRAWKRRMSRGQTGVQAAYNQLVQDASLVRHFETVYVPGLLQTPEYARRVLAEMVTLHGPGVDDVDAAVAVRMQRQQALYNSRKRFEFLLAEPVLRWMLCPPAVMLGQLDRLQTAAALPNVRFGIVPLAPPAGPLPITPQNAFQLYDDLAVAETFIGETAHQGDEAAAYARVLDLLWDQAVTGEEARRLIVRAADAVRAGAVSSPPEQPG